MNEIKLTDILTEDQIQEITAKFVERQPTKHQLAVIAKFRKDYGEGKAHTVEAENVSFAAKLPIEWLEGPPETERPGVGVMMVGNARKFIITEIDDTKAYLTVNAKGSHIWLDIDVIKHSRHAKPKEITAFFHPGIDINDPNYTEKMAESVMGETAYVDNADEVGEELFPVIEKAIGGDGEELISTKFKDQVEEQEDNHQYAYIDPANTPGNNET